MLFDSISYVSGADHLYDIAGSTLSAPSDDDVLMRFEAPRDFTIPANFAGTVASVPTTVPSGSAAVFQLKVDGSNVSGATMTFAVSTGALTLGTFSAESVSAGDLVELVCTSANSIDGVAWTIKTTAS